MSVAWRLRGWSAIPPRCRRKVVEPSTENDPHGRDAWLTHDRRKNANAFGGVMPGTVTVTGSGEPSDRFIFRYRHRSVES
jgi:hypothetical protein